MRKSIIFSIFLFLFLSTLSNSQNKTYHKVNESGFWTGLQKVGAAAKADGSKKYEFEDWTLYFPMRYTNFVRKFQKNGKTYEYYVKVCDKGIYDPKIRVKDGPGKASQAYDDSDGSETKLLLQGVNEAITKILKSSNTASL